MRDSFRDATEQAALVRRGEVSPGDLLEETIQRIEKLNGELNAIIIPTFDKARREARSAPDSPFRGVPYVVKDITVRSKGDLYTGSIKGLKDAGYRPDHDSYLVERMRNAGFVLLGRTNTPEMAISMTTEPLAWGPTRNPWDPARSAGASSGGSGAAVGSGMVPVAHGNDGGGSVRMPAAVNGVVGLKPTRGRISAGPDLSVCDLVAGDAHEGLMTRSVRDMAAVLDVVGGHRPGDGYAAPTPVASFASVVGTDPGPMRIGVLDHDPTGACPIHPDNRAGVRRVADVLADLGHDVAEGYPEAMAASLTWPPEFMRVISVAILREIRHYGELIGRELTADDVEPRTWAVMEAGKRITGTQYAEGIDKLRLRQQEIECWWEEGWDLLLSPTTLCSEPPEIGRVEATPEELEYTILAFAGEIPEDVLATQGDDAEAVADKYAGLTDLLVAFNITGQPAITLPLWESQTGFPIGMHLVGACGREDVLFQVGAQLEAEMPWAGRRPRVSV